LPKQRVNQQTTEYHYAKINRKDCENSGEEIGKRAATGGENEGARSSHGRDAGGGRKGRSDPRCIVAVYFHGKLDFNPVQMKAQ